MNNSVYPAGIRFPGRDFLVSPIPTFKPIQPPPQLLPAFRFLMLKWPGRKPDHLLPLSSVKVWRYSLPPPSDRLHGVTYNYADGQLLFFLSLYGAQHPKSGPGRLIFEVSILHTHTLGRTILNEYSARRRRCCLYNKHKRRTSMLSSVFESAVPAIEWLQN